MSFYPMDGSQGVYTRYDSYVQKQTSYWLWLAAALFLFIAFGLVGSRLKTFVSAEQASQEMPRQSTLALVDPEPSQIPTVVATIDRSPELQAELEAWQAKQQKGEWAFYISSLENDEMKVGINETTPMDLASIYKLFLIKPLGQKIPVDAWGNTNITERSYESCVIAMLAVSDNPCAEAIAAKIGWSALHRQNHADGYSSSVFNREDFLAASAADTGLLLDRLYHGDGYDAKTRQLALDALSTPKGIEAIRKTCNGCIVYNKTGDLMGVKHDAGIVQKSGKSYVVVMFSRHASWSQLAEASSIIHNRL